MVSLLIVSFSKMLIDFIPDMVGVLLAEFGGFMKAPGGASMNIVITITKLCGKSTFIRKFGDDEFGHILADILKKNGVVDEGNLFDPHTRITLAFVTLKSDEEREFMFY